MHPFWPTPLLSCGRGSSSWRSSSICFPNKPLSQTGRRADAAQPSIFPPFAAVQVRSIFNKSIKFSFAPRNQINRNRPQLLLLLLASSFSDSNSDVWASPWLHFCFGLCGVNNAPTAVEMEVHTKEEARLEARSWIPNPQTKTDESQRTVGPKTKGIGLGFEACFGLHA